MAVSSPMKSGGSRLLNRAKSKSNVRDHAQQSPYTFCSALYTVPVMHFSLLNKSKEFWLFLLLAL